MFLLVTNAISVSGKTGDAQADLNAQPGWRSRMRGASKYPFLPLLELEIGILPIERCDTEQGGQLRVWIKGTKQTPI